MTPYDRDFYDMQRRGSRRSASVVLPIVFELVDVASVLDVGCGVGTWLAEARDLGVDDVVGVDGAYVDRSLLQVPPEVFRPHDLTTPLRLGRDFDLVISLEVAEHLAEEHAGAFVATIAAHGDTVMFSAAIPWQLGHDHVNAQWPSYWCERFAEHGFRPVDVIRPCIWDNDRVEAFYRQNTILFLREGAELSRPMPAMPVLDVVHPAYFDRLMRISRAPGVLPSLAAAGRSARDAGRRRNPLRRRPRR